MTQSLRKRFSRRFPSYGLVLSTLTMVVVFAIVFIASYLLGAEMSSSTHLDYLKADVAKHNATSTLAPTLPQKQETTMSPHVMSTTTSTPRPTTRFTWLNAKWMSSTQTTPPEPTKSSSLAMSPASPLSTTTPPPTTTLPPELNRWLSYPLPDDWVECIRRNLQLDETGHPLRAVTEMTDAIPLLITPLTGDARFFPYFVCSMDVPVRYQLVIQNERDPETVAVVDELQRRFGDSGRLLVLRNRYNRGYSGSMNQGFEWALKERTMEEVPWVFACGVDTIFEKGLLASLVEVVRNNTQNDAAMMELLQEEVAMEERLAREGNLSYYEKWAPPGRPLTVLRSGFSGVPLNVRTASLMPDRVRYMVADENRVNGSFSNDELRTRFFGNYVASVTPVPSALGTIAFTRLALSTAGLFDENYFPAYMDDIDIRWRQFAYGFGAIHAEGNNPIRWHHYNAANLRGGLLFFDPILRKYGTEDNSSRWAFNGYLRRSNGLYDRLKHGPRDRNGVWRQSVEKGEYNFTRFNVSGYPADTWVLDETVRECMFRHTHNYSTHAWSRPERCTYNPETLAQSGVLGLDQLQSYLAVVKAGAYLEKA